MSGAELGGREPPHSVESERMVLGSWLSEGMETIPMALVEHGLKSVDFYYRSHGVIAAAILEVHESRKGLVDAMLVTTVLRERGVLEDIGGVSYLIDLARDAPMMRVNPGSLHEHFRQVKNYALIRRGIAVAMDTVKQGYEAEDGESFLLTAPSRFYDELPTRRDKETVGSLLDKAIARWEEIALLPPGQRPLMGLESGIPRLDVITSGFQPGLNLLAGRPSAGKTSLEGCISTWNAMHGIPVGRICNDMSKNMVVLRDACREATVSMAKLNKGFAGAKDIAKIKEAKERILQWPMHIESGMYDIREICTWARLMKAKHDIQLLTIDYIQQCRCPWMVRAGEHEVMTEVSGRLKALSFELGIPVLALAQFNREGEKHGSRKPQLSDLRGSGTLEQEASMAMFVYKSPDYEYSEVEPDVESKRRAVCLDVAKQQNGETGTVECWLHGPYFMFDQADPNWGKF
jgi:replicative DNA helicase